MKIKTSENDKNLLKNRYKVENSIQQIKNTIELILEETD